jgi:hypothetical protein
LDCGFEVNALGSVNIFTAAAAGDCVPKVSDPSEFVTNVKMTLKSALEDLRQTTLGAVSGLLGRLAYLASLRRGHGRYEHWGMEMVHGTESSHRALKTVHSEVVASVLQAPIAVLVEDLERTSRESGVDARAYLASMRDHFEDLLPGERQDSPAGAHLSSVLAALSSLEKNRSRATPLVS